MGDCQSQFRFGGNARVRRHNLFSDRLYKTGLKIDAVEKTKTTKFTVCPVEDRPNHENQTKQ